MIPTLLATLALAVPLPAPMPTVAVVRHPCGDAALQGCYRWPVNRVQLARRLSQRRQRYVLRHEFGHAFDYLNVSTAERRRLHFPPRGSERFAQRYARCTPAHSGRDYCVRIRAAQP